MFKSMLNTKQFFYHGFWLGGGCAANQSEAMFEN